MRAIVRVYDKSSASPCWFWVVDDIEVDWIPDENLTNDSMQL